MEQEASGNEAERDILALFSPMIKTASENVTEGSWLTGP